MEKQLDFAGKTILVTGSGRNIGRAIILEFASRGANVVINARSNREEADAVLAEAEALGAKGIVVMGEAANRATVDAMKAQIEAAFGRLDIYVSNAARRFHKDFLEISDDEWFRYLNQQLTASYYLAKAFIPGMKEGGYGRIIHMNGPDGFVGGWTRVPHSVAKGGLRTLTKSLAAGVGQFGITVNDINPGYAGTVRDPATHPELVSGDLSGRLANRIPIGKQTDLEDIAFACAYLCSPRAGSITGSSIHLDGGMHMQG